MLMQRVCLISGPPFAYLYGRVVLKRSLHETDFEPILGCYFQENAIVFLILYHKLFDFCKNERQYLQS